MNGKPDFHPVKVKLCSKCGKCLNEDAKKCNTPGCKGGTLEPYVRLGVSLYPADAPELDEYRAAGVL